MADFKKLKIWQTAHRLTLQIYELTKLLPDDEKFGLISQLRRAAVSVQPNIAEGETRYTPASKVAFFVDSRSSCAEIITQLTIIKDVYKNLKKESSLLIENYEILAKQINSLITFRKNYELTQKPKNLISQGT